MLSMYICVLRSIKMLFNSFHKVSLTLIRPDLKVEEVGTGGALCFERGFTRTFPGNQDVAVK